jgi:sugar lactone lactonase YvrE
MKTLTTLVISLLVPQLVFSAVIKPEDQSFVKVANPDAKLDTLATGLRFTEGPVWIAAEGSDGYLLFSDIPADIIYRWSAGDGLSPWRSPSGKSNGLLLDSAGRLLACEHGNRRVSLVLSPDSAVTLCGSYNGGKLNSPNDIALDADGSLWFTDPPYGLEGQKQEQPAQYVFHMPAGGGEPVVVAGDFYRPNGIVFSPDKKTLYISDSGKRLVRSFSVTPDGLRENDLFAEISPGGPDGMCVDESGRVYVTAGDGVQVFSPEGKLLGRILTPQKPTNCCFGGKEYKTLFITARPDVYAVKLMVCGLP